MRKLVVGSRRSKLALTQSKQFIDKLKAIDPSLEIEIKEIVTKGDRIVNQQLSKVGGKGLFVKEIQNELFNNDIDMAIHSLKDVPSIIPEGLTLGCIPDREIPFDAYIAKNHVPLEELPKNSIVGTSSLRRGAQILSKYPHLKIKWIRGNIDTRLNKLETEDYDAIILAAAGLKRMGWSDDVVTTYLDKDTLLPAIGQGALGIECRSNDIELLELLQKVHNNEVANCVTAERTFLAAMDGSCQVPIGGYANYNNNNEIEFTGLIMTPDGKERYEHTEVGTDPVKLGNRVSEILKEQGAYEIIRKLNEEASH
ncbi:MULTISPECIES: hydroxymethylbilane synthase [Staphylococcus]|jgi:hydroxymethylbilane synthase|uniref:Porphobilinogen deaminase n=1 Tax=Staphylococcus hominis TaxID=1290 RepID=A0A4Q9WPR2_STAHO|nr:MULTISPECIES: hydroxymethylbilane synthase [Staphylococcus]EUZ70570.1 porphobilinogen deaminase [Staphylococcus sp. M0480]OFK82052.1 hydroxymethylbilane synthase [Staphylococcus sp. HMSC057A02]OFM77439.1 hydroxymethylbilane synthase [Staphylococcus sp. HMSC074B09]OFM93425.1 hydroxymethylbilane synthase [Staphylococcus sp. HMSC078D05]OFN12946.1 hydroxymethylbilane synthase [Staphylococcus sp. HMSC058D09]OFR10626.1 hydroxymethylbilane synthase [Staphylococcus sp. HMSC078E07]OFS48691.1 hydro